VSTKEKNRKHGGRGAEKTEPRAEAEQAKEKGADDEIVREFLLESNENLDRLDRELVSLEKDPKDRETLSSIFRTIHTIKGTCGFLGFGKLESVAHAGENLLSLLRDGAIALTPQRTTALLSLVDAVRQMLGSIEAKGNEGERNDEGLVETLKRLQKDGEGKEVKEVNEVKEKREEVAVARTTNPASAESPEGPEPPKQLGKILVEMGTVTPEDVAYAVQKQLEGDGRSIGEILLERGMVKSQDLLAAVQVQQASKSAVNESSIRVDVVLLDRLMNLVGELVLARNQILQHTQGVQDAGLVASGQRLNLITSELQEGVMKTRMQPIGNIWSKFPRTVRDVAMSCGKSVRIEMEGKETELDKTIIEAIKDPLTHLVRNSVDHGIETPDKRVQAGKTEEGLLLLRAYHEGGQVEFEPAGKHTGWSGPGDRGDEFCPSAGGEPGDDECDGASAGVADAAGFPEVNLGLHSSETLNKLTILSDEMRSACPRRPGEAKYPSANCLQGGRDPAGASGARRMTSFGSRCAKAAG
jgi:two-component system chemotaxis sensor kinase CheA